MNSLNIQFHMLFEELIDFVSEVSARYQLEVELERWYPKATREISVGIDLSRVVNEFGGVDRIWLLCRLPESQKTERLMLNVGRLKGNRLAQSQLAAGTSNALVFEILKQVAADLNHRTTPGIWVITESGNVNYQKKFRFSRGAADAARSGMIELVGIAFTQSFRVDPPNDVR